MKDKEKQIKKMPICVNCIHAYVCDEYNLNRDMLRKRCAYHNDHFVDIKNSVVLSREEYEKLKMLKEGHITCEDVLEFIEKARKETAEKDFCTIIKALEERKERVKVFYGVAESAAVDIAIRTVKKLAKQFSAEIKE